MDTVENKLTIFSVLFTGIQRWIRQAQLHCTHVQSAATERCDAASVRDAWYEVQVCTPGHAFGQTGSTLVIHETLAAADQKMSSQAACTALTMMALNGSMKVTPSHGCTPLIIITRKKKYGNQGG